jgi:hypothetical protein
MHLLIALFLFASCQKQTPWRIYQESAKPVRQLFVIGDSLFYVGTYGDGLYKVENGRWQKEPGLAPDEFVMCLKPGEDGSLWAGTAKHGTYRQVLGAWKCFDSSNAWDLLAGKDSVVWIGVRYGGIRCFSNGETAFIDRRNGLPDNEITCMAEEPSGKVWVGTVRGGACSLKNNSFGYLNGKNGLSGNYIRAFLCDSVLRYVGSWDGGLDLWNGSAWQHVPEVKRPVVKLARDAQGRVWAGTWGGGVFVRKDGEWENISSKNSPLPDDHVIDIRFSPSGRVYFATSKGVAIFKP